MLQRALGFTLTVMTAAVWLSPQAATARSRQGELPWLRTESQHFEIHYLPVLAPELDRVVRSAERAYGRISGRLQFCPRHQSAAGDVCPFWSNHARTCGGLRNQ